MIPCYLGIQIAVAYLLATKITSIYVNRQQKLWQLVLIALLSGSVLSCAMISQADAWWNKGSSYYHPQAARIINQASRPLVISDTKTGRILTLSHLLEPKVWFKAQPYCRTCRSNFSLHAKKDFLDIPEGFSDVFLFSPSKKLQAGLEKKYKIEPSYLKGELWRLEP